MFFFILMAFQEIVFDGTTRSIAVDWLPLVRVQAPEPAFRVRVLEAENIDEEAVEFAVDIPGTLCGTKVMEYPQQLMPIHILQITYQSYITA